jgi:hypothetical protein
MSQQSNTTDQQATALRDELAAVKAETEALQHATREMLAQVRAEILRCQGMLAEAQIDLAAKRAWRRGEE